MYSFKLLNYTFRKSKKLKAENSRDFPREFEHSWIPGNSRSGIPGGDRHHTRCQNTRM